MAPTDKSELRYTLKNLSLKLDDLSTCNDLIAKHGAALQRSLTELDGLKIPAESGEKLKVVNERATLFRITSNAMINVSVPSPPPTLPSPSLAPWATPGGYSHSPRPGQWSPELLPLSTRTSNRLWREGWSSGGDAHILYQKD